MSTSSISDLSSNLQSVLETARQGTGSTTNTPGNNLDGVNTTSARFRPDISQLSPFVELHALQNLLQSDQTKYQQVTQQIATNLQAAAQTAQGDGNTTAANQLSQLATDFSNASANGGLPALENLAQGAGTGQHQQYAESDLENPLGIILDTLSSAGISFPKS